MSAHSQGQPPTIRQSNSWRHLPEVKFKIMNLPNGTTTRQLWQQFSSQGHIVQIDILDNASRCSDVAYIIFRPPPTRDFWRDSATYSTKSSPPRLLRIELVPSSRTFMHQSPVNRNVYYPERVNLKSNVLNFGFLFDRNSMMIMQSSHAMPGGVSFLLNLLRREIEISFTINAPAKNRRDELRITRYKLVFGLAKLRHAFSISSPEIKHKRALIIALECPPHVYQLNQDIKCSHDDAIRYWNERNAWLRVTDIVQSQAMLLRAPITLEKKDAIIDIGRWTLYRLIFDASQNNLDHYGIVIKALSDYNVTIRRQSDIEIIGREEALIWDVMSGISRAGDTDAGALEMLTNDSYALEYSVSYQLSVCISRGVFNEHNLSRDFVERLAKMNPNEARTLLEKVAEGQERLYEPMQIFDESSFRVTRPRKVPKHCALTRTATVTPSMIYFGSPTVEISNRIIRQYSEHGERFLRVRFTEERTRDRIFAPGDNTQEKVFARIQRTLTNGIVIGDRHFQFLAFGTSQFREHGAWFFASTPTLSPVDIRAWMGDFSHIKVIAKNAARLGQCFSTSRAIHSSGVSLQEIADVKRNGYIFTDGTGMISSFLARLIAHELGLPSGEDRYPSLFQFRLGGCKGVLTVWPQIRERDIHIRPSQYKFKAVHQGLEIVRTSSYAIASLNRQIIIVLSTLGIPDHVFLKKQREMLAGLEVVTHNETAALGMLQKFIDANQTTLTMAGMILDGFQKSGDPFMATILELWRAWNIKYLKEKAKILIGKGAFLLGCSDESGILRGHVNTNLVDAGRWYSPRSIQDPFLVPEVFVQIPDPESGGQYRVVQGICILGRNPSLHPGDIRVVQAVDRPELRHLRDVVVLPQTGDRDLANMCSGGDLDGDDYFLMWDRDLIPPEWNEEPLSYEAPDPIRAEGEVTISDITRFFVTYMKNDRLGAIATAHLAHADGSEIGVRDPKCLALAALHSSAVDFPKTGQPAVMPKALRIFKRPHYLRKSHTEANDRFYHSKSVLGRLFDEVELVNFAPKFENAFDQRILSAYKLSPELLSTARNVKHEYDAAIRRIMAQHEIRTEFEVWTTFVLEHNNQSSDYKIAEELGKLTLALKQNFQRICYEKAGVPYGSTLGQDFAIIGPFIAAMYTVTAEEMRKAVRDRQRAANEGGGQFAAAKPKARTMPLMSFPWIFPKELGRIARGELAGYATSFGTTHHSQRSNKIKKPDVVDAALDQLAKGNDILTAQGVRQVGDILDLFNSVPQSLQASQVGRDTLKTTEQDQISEVDTVHQVRDISPAEIQRQQDDSPDARTSGSDLLPNDSGDDADNEGIRVTGAENSEGEQSSYCESHTPLIHSEPMTFERLNAKIKREDPDAEDLLVFGETDNGPDPERINSTPVKNMSTNSSGHSWFEVGHRRVRSSEQWINQWEQTCAQERAEIDFKAAKMKNLYWQAPEHDDGGVDDPFASPRKKNVTNRKITGPSVDIGQGYTEIENKPRGSILDNEHDEDDIIVDTLAVATLNQRDKDYSSRDSELIDLQPKSTERSGHFEHTDKDGNFEARRLSQQTKRIKSEEVLIDLDEAAVNPWQRLENLMDSKVED